MTQKMKQQQFEAEEKDILNPLTWDNEQRKDALKSAALSVAFFAVMILLITIFG